MSISNCGFTLPSGPLNWTNLELHDWLYIDFVSYNMSSCKTLMPHCGPNYLWGQWLEQIRICSMSGRCHVNLNFSGPVVLDKKIFKWSRPIFILFFLIISCWRGHGHSFEQNLSALHPTMMCDNFHWILPSGSGKGNENVKRLQRWRRPIRKTHFSHRLR